MRSTLSKLSVFFVLSLIAAFASSQTQVNPATQVRWPVLTGTVDPAPPTWVCAAANYGQPYTNTATGKQFTCAASGWVNVAAAAVPGGANQDAQINVSGAFGSDTGVYTYNVSTHTLNLKNVSAVGTVTGQTTNGTVNSDVLGGVTTTLANALCTTAGCFFARPQTSADTATIPNLFTLALTNIHAQDLSKAGAADYYWNNTAPVSSGNDFRYARNTFCGWDTAITSTLGARYCYYTNFIYAPPSGQYVTGEPTGSKTHSDTTWVYSRGINQDHGFIDNYFSIGDKDAYRGYLNHRTGSIAGSDESIEGFGLDINSQPPPSGTVTTGGAGATVVKINFTSNAGNQADGLELIDEADVIDSGNYVGALTVGAGNAPSTFQTVDINGNPVTHSVSSGIATLTSACGSTTIRNQQQSTVCNVTINSGSFASGGTNFVCVADWHYYEQAAITATGTGTLTLNLAYSHPSGVEIFQGPGCDGRMVLGNGSTPLTTAQVTSYAIAGAPDTTHYAVVVKNLGGQDGNISVPLSQLNPIVGTGPWVLGQPQRSGNVVTVPINGALGAVDFNGYTAPGSSQIYISGVTPSDFNGAITGVTYNPQAQTLSWNQTGPNESASTNATISLRGANNYTIYCGAETIGIPNVLASSLQTPVLDGSLDIEPNGCTWTAGDHVIQPNAYNEHLAHDERGVASDSSDLLPLNGPNSSREYLGVHGAEMSGFVFDNFPGGAGDSVSSFLGHGGLFTPYTYAVLDGGVFNTFVHMLYAPEISLFTLGCPASGCSSTSQVVNLFNIGGNAGGGVLGFDTHNSTWTFSNPVTAPSSTSSITAGGGVGIEGNWGGQTLNTFLLTESLGHNYASWGVGPIGDSTATISAGTYVAPTVVAGALLPLPNTVVVHGTLGTTTYTYACTAVTGSGKETPLGTSISQSLGNATLNGTNYNQVYCLAQAGTGTLNFYRISSTGGLSPGLICSGVLPVRGAEFCNDTGQAAGAAPPTVDTSGSLTIAGHSFTGESGAGTNILAVGPSTSGYLPMFSAAGVGNSHCDDGLTATGVITCTEPISVVVSYPAYTSLTAGSGNIPALAANSAGFAAPVTGGTSWLGKLPATITAGLLHFAAPAVGDGVNESIITSAPVGLGTADVSGVLPVANGGTGAQGAEVVAFSATPTFSTSFGVSRIVLTANVTSFTLGAGADGQAKQLCFAQDAAGSHTVAAPANVHGFFTVGATASKWSCQGFVYDSTDSIWLATGPGVTNE